MKLQNVSRGTRIVNVKGPGDSVMSLSLEPGQTVDNVEVVNTEDPVFQSFVENGNLIVDGGKKTRRQAEGDLEGLSQRQNQLKEELAKIEQEKRVLEDALNAPRFQNDPKLRSDRQAAMTSGNTPGLADPLPVGTDKQSDPKTLEAQGHDAKEAQEADPAKGGIDAVKSAPALTNPFAPKPQQGADDPANQQAMAKGAKK